MWMHASLHGAWLQQAAADSTSFFSLNFHVGISHWTSSQFHGRILFRLRRFSYKCSKPKMFLSNLLSSRFSSLGPRSAMKASQLTSVHYNCYFVTLSCERRKERQRHGRNYDLCSLTSSSSQTCNINARFYL